MTVTNLTQNMQTNLAYAKKVQKQKQEVANPIKTQKSEDEPDKVSRIKKEIQQGTYKVDLKKTSEKMALNLLNP